MASREFGRIRSRSPRTGRTNQQPRPLRIPSYGSAATLASRPLPLSIEAHRWRRLAISLQNMAALLADGSVDLHATVDISQDLLDELRNGLAEPYSDRGPAHAVLLDND